MASDSATLFTILCVNISICIDLIGAPITAYILFKQLRRTCPSWRRNYAEDPGGGSNWMYRMIYFVMSLCITANTMLNLKFPVLFSHTEWFESTFANKTVFQDSAWNAVFAISLGCNYSGSFIQFAIILSFLVSRLKLDTFDTMRFAKIDIFMVFATFAGGFALFLPIAIHPVYFLKLDGGFYVLKTESTCMVWVVLTLGTLLIVMAVIGFFVMRKTYGKLKKLQMVTKEGESSRVAEQRCVENKKRRVAYKNSTAILTTAFVLGFVNTAAIRLCVEIHALEFLFQYVYAFLMITSSFICYSLPASLCVVHKQTREDAQEGVTLVLPRPCCPRTWKRRDAVVQSIHPKDSSFLQEISSRI